MTNQETIANLNMIRVGFVDPATKEQMKLIYDTFDNAIKALEQEPNGDVISRQAVLKAMCDASIPIIYKGKPSFVVDYVGVIETVPPVNPKEPKTGHWIFAGEENEEETRNGNFRYVCSKCSYSDVHAKSTEVPYCWHCGARMVEPQKSEE